MRRLLLICTFAGLLLSAAPALAAAPGGGYYVTGLGDAPGAGCRPYAVAPYMLCDSVRAAVVAANAGAGGSIVLMAPGTYALAQGPLTIAHDTMILGINARATTLAGDGHSRVLDIAAGARVELDRLTISGGRAPAGEGGGNIRSLGMLIVTDSRITNGSAAFGGGIDSEGWLDVEQSTIDHNTAAQNGGGIFKSDHELMQLFSSTVAFNSAGLVGGIALAPNAPTLMSAVTIARNRTSSGQGVGGIEGGRGLLIDASIVAANLGAGGGLSNCRNNSGPIKNLGGNVSDGSDCTLFTQPATPIGLSAELVNAGGGTDVLTIPSTSSAKGVAACTGDSESGFGGDQRGAPRASSHCDAGAFQEGAVAPALSSDPFTLPAPPPPVTPAPLPAPKAPPAGPKPVLDRTVVIGRSGGRVFFAQPGSSKRSLLTDASAIPVGSTIYAKQGYVRVTSVPKLGAPAQSDVFWGGDFKLTQSRGITQLVLTEKLGCAKAKASTARPALPRTRELWGQGVAPFSVRGAYATATNRSGRWLVHDTCTSTLTRTTQGTVRVSDRVKHRSVTVRVGKPYTARRR